MNAIRGLVRERHIPPQIPPNSDAYQFWPLPRPLTPNCSTTH